MFSNQKLPLAQFTMGLMYVYGRGVLQDDVKAHMWLNLATSAGFSQAAEPLDRIAQKMTQEQVLHAQALANSWQAANEEFFHLSR